MLTYRWKGLWRHVEYQETPDGSVRAEVSIEKQGTMTAETGKEVIVGVVNSYDKLGDIIHFEVQETET